MWRVNNPSVQENLVTLSEQNMMGSSSSTLWGYLYGKTDDVNVFNKPEVSRDNSLLQTSRCQWLNGTWWTLRHRRVWYLSDKTDDANVFNRPVVWMANPFSLQTKTITSLLQRIYDLVPLSKQHLVDVKTDDVNVFNRPEVWRVNNSVLQTTWCLWVNRT